MKMIQTNESSNIQQMKDSDIITKFCSVKNSALGKESPSSAQSELNTAATSDARIDILGGGGGSVSTPQGGAPGSSDKVTP